MRIRHQMDRGDRGDDKAACFMLLLDHGNCTVLIDEAKIPMRSKQESFVAITVECADTRRSRLADAC